MTKKYMLPTCENIQRFLNISTYQTFPPTKEFKLINVHFHSLWTQIKNYYFLKNSNLLKTWRYFKVQMPTIYNKTTKKKKKKHVGTFRIDEYLEKNPSAHPLIV